MFRRLVMTFLVVLSTKMHSGIIEKNEEVRNVKYMPREKAWNVNLANAKHARQLHLRIPVS